MCVCFPIQNPIPKSSPQDSLRLWRPYVIPLSAPPPVECRSLHHTRDSYNSMHHSASSLPFLVKCSSLMQISYTYVPGCLCWRFPCFSHFYSHYEAFRQRIQLVYSNAKLITYQTDLYRTHVMCFTAMSRCAVPILMAII